MNKLLNRLSARERRLAGATGLVVAAVVAWMAVMPAVGYLGDLDSRIDTLEEQLYSNTYQAALSKVVSARYNTLAAQHSTAWTEAEISDGLQRELDRLSLKTPPPPDGSGGSGPRLLTITYRPEGQLTAYSGYREYQTTFLTQPTTIGAIAEFLRRLQESPQTLRVDKLDLRREPNNKQVTASISVTRTVVDRKAADGETAAVPAEGTAKPAGNLVSNPGFEAWNDTRKQFAEWSTEGCTVSPDSEHAVEGKLAAKAVFSAKRGRLFQDQKLMAGRTYRLTLHAAAQGVVSFSVVNREAKAFDLPEQKVQNDGKMREYKAEFTVTGTAGQMVPVVAPLFLLTGEGATVYADQILLEEVKK